MKNKKTIIIKHRLHYTRKHVFFLPSSFNGNIVVQMACIVHPHVITCYAICTLHTNNKLSYNTHCALWGVKTKKANLKCIVYVQAGIEENFSCIFIVRKERSTRQCVYVNRKGFTYCRHHYVLNAENSACEINEFAM